MKIAVIGAGAIGGLVAGYLKFKGEDVTLIGHADSIKAIEENGLQISGVRGNFNIRIDVAERLDFRPDLVILATKTQDIQKAARENLRFIKDTIVLTTQNGVQAEKILAKSIPGKNILPSIVMFGSTYLEPAKVVHNFEGSWITGKMPGRNDELIFEAHAVLNKIFPTLISDNILGMKYLKIFINANNCIPAILRMSMQAAFSDPEICCISIAIWKEGLDIVSKTGISLVSLPDFPLERLMKLTSMPLKEAAGIFSGIMVNLSREPLYGSILQSIRRNRSSEIDYINGEFVSLAEANGLEAPLNKKLVKMVHAVEDTGKFFSKERLIRETKDSVIS